MVPFREICPWLNEKVLISSGRPCSDPELVELGVILRISIMDSPSGRFCLTHWTSSKNGKNRVLKTDMFGTTI
jgi:hypothetical protein